MNDIVIVEDELIAAEYLREVLLQNDFNVLSVIDNGREAMQEIPKLKPDIVLMDIMLKDNISGSEVSLHLKQFAPTVAIIFLTAYADNEMVEYAIEANTFGYLMKPYNEKEIINTLKVVSARMNESDNESNQKNFQVQITSSFIFDILQNRLLENSIEIKLGKNALKLLEILCRNVNSTVSNEQISMHIWGELRNDITIRTQIHRIKEKLGPNIIQNVNGIGYMIENIDKKS